MSPFLPQLDTKLLVGKGHDFCLFVFVLYFQNQTSRLRKKWYSITTCWVNIENPGPGEYRKQTSLIVTPNAHVCVFGKPSLFLQSSTWICQNLSWQPGFRAGQRFWSWPSVSQRSFLCQCKPLLNCYGLTIWEWQDDQSRVDIQNTPTACL